MIYFNKFDHLALTTDVQQYRVVDHDDGDDDMATEVQTNFVKTLTLSRYSRFILIILNTKKQHQTWYTQLHVGVVATDRRECKRNYIIR